MRLAINLIKWRILAKRKYSAGNIENTDNNAMSEKQRRK